MSNVKTWIAGKKKWLLAASAILTALVAWSTGAVDFKTLFANIMQSLFGS